MNNTINISKKSLWALLCSLSLPDKRWIAEHLIAQSKKADKKTEKSFKELQTNTSQNTDYKSFYDEMFEKFSGDYCGDGDALTIAEELRNGRVNTRTVETW